MGGLPGEGEEFPGQVSESSQITIMTLRERCYRIVCRIFRREIIRDGFRGVLGRDPEEEALKAYKGSFKGLGTESLIRELSESEEAWKKQKEAHAEELIRDAYLGVLEREPEEEALRAYRYKIKEIGVAGVIRKVSKSEEAWKNLLADYSNRLVSEMYRSILKREPDTKGLENYSHKIRVSGSISSALASITNSEEYKKKLYGAHRLGAGICDFSANVLSEVKTVFLHLPKTGGTTMHHLLKKHYPEQSICPERFNGLRNYAAGELANYRMFSGHFDLPSANLIPGNKKIITMLREPVSRLISLYYFQRAHRMEEIERHNLHIARLANKYSISEFFQDPEVRAMPGINNSMTRILTQTIEGCKSDAKVNHDDDYLQLEKALEALESLTAFGIMERYEESIKLIFPKLNLPVPEEVPKKQVLDVIANEEKGLRKIEKEPVTEEVIKLIMENVTSDIWLYKKAVGIFERRSKEISKYNNINIISSYLS